MTMWVNPINSWKTTAVSQVEVELNSYCARSQTIAQRRYSPKIPYNTCCIGILPTDQLSQRRSAISGGCHCGACWPWPGEADYWITSSLRSAGRWIFKFFHLDNLALRNFHGRQMDAVYFQIVQVFEMLSLTWLTPFSPHCTGAEKAVHGHCHSSRSKLLGWSGMMKACTLIVLPRFSTNKAGSFPFDIRE